MRLLEARSAVQVMPVVAMVLVVVLLGVFMALLNRSEREEEQLTLIKDVLWVEQTLHFQLTSDVEKLQGLADTLNRGDGEPSVHLPAMRHVVAANPAVEQILWLDSGGSVVLAVPPGPEGRVLDDAFGPNPRMDAVMMARSLGRPAYSAAYRQLGGNWAFDAVVPLFDGAGVSGVLVASFSLDAVLAHHVPWWIAGRYQVEVVDAMGTVLAAKSRMAVPEPRRSHSIPFDPPGGGLTLVATIHQIPSNAVRNALMMAIFALTALALFSLWTVRRHIGRRVQAEQALRDEHAFRKAMEDSLTVGMRARDLQGRVTYVNPAFCRMFGWGPEELIGKGPIMPYWPPEDMDKVKAAFDVVMAGQAPPDGFEIRFMRRSGERFDALVYEAPLIDADGRQTGWMASILDITERKREAELARHQQERLQQTARLITMGEMASTLAHELNQPLAAIASYSTGCLNRLRTDASSREEVIVALEKLAQQARRAGQIIRRVHDFVRKREPNVAPCDIIEVMEDSVALLSPDARKHGVQIEVEAPGGTPPVCADRILIQQVLLNLMRNGMEAMAHTPRDRRLLHLSVAVQNGGVLVRVRDAGSGIGPEVEKTLFSPFFTTKTEGMGMGLNICRSIVEHHRGRLWHEAPEEGGTVFVFTLPAAEAAP